MNIFLAHILYFAVGVVQDLLITSYYQAIAKQFPAKSAVLSFVVTLVNLSVLYGIINGIQDQVATIILVYALGCGVGTYIIVKRGNKTALPI